ncbi:hypothetical protein HAX54_015182 [Datura stramonium]|uniref:Uncharacterized protein n=1 Tax=Datura stramonium TaxID=4076 RepID=A0ABS8TSA0_DATST|nr:hypothetical protein [Datura stramonium]
MGTHKLQIPNLPLSLPHGSKLHRGTRNRKGRLQYDRRQKKSGVSRWRSQVYITRNWSKGAGYGRFADSEHYPKGGVDEKVNKGTILNELSPPDDRLALLKGKNKLVSTIEKGGRLGYLNKALFNSIRKPTRELSVTNINLDSDTEDPNDVYSVKGEVEKNLARANNINDRNKMLLGGLNQISANKTSARNFHWKKQRLRIPEGI